MNANEKLNDFRLHGDRLYLEDGQNFEFKYLRRPVAVMNPDLKQYEFSFEVGVKTHKLRLSRDNYYKIKMLFFRNPKLNDPVEYASWENSEQYKITSRRAQFNRIRMIGSSCILFNKNETIDINQCIKAKISENRNKKLVLHLCFINVRDNLLKFRDIQFPETKHDQLELLYLKMSEVSKENTPLKERSGVKTNY